MDLETASDSAIPRQSLTSAVADKLRDQIIRGELPEGAQLLQDAIATQYQVNQIPVREALRQLDAEGLIAIVPNPPCPGGLDLLSVEHRKLGRIGSLSSRAARRRSTSVRLNFQAGA